MKVSLKAASLSIAAITVALSFIPDLEGIRLRAYLDPVGIPTICSGYTPGVKLGDISTREDCNKKTVEMLEWADNIFKTSVPENIREQLHPNTYASFLSFIYNVGPGKKGVKDGFLALKSTGQPSTMYKKLVAGDIRGACEQFKYWQRPRLRGIQERRKFEEKLCLSGLNSQ